MELYAEMGGYPLEEPDRRFHVVTVSEENDECLILEAYQYQGRTDFYGPDEVLYFTNLGLEADHEGLSDV